jgi:hypothetical protein
MIKVGFPSHALALGTGDPCSRSIDGVTGAKVIPIICAFVANLFMIMGLTLRTTGVGSGALHLLLILGALVLLATAFLYLSPGSPVWVNVGAVAGGFAGGLVAYLRGEVLIRRSLVPE